MLKWSMVILGNPTQNSEFGGASKATMFFVYVNFDNVKMYQKFILQSFWLFQMKVEALHYCYGESGPCHPFFGVKMFRLNTCYKFGPCPPCTPVSQDFQKSRKIHHQYGQNHLYPIISWGMLVTFSKELMQNVC